MHIQHNPLDRFRAVFEVIVLLIGAEGNQHTVSRSQFFTQFLSSNLKSSLMFCGCFFIKYFGIFVMADPQSRTYRITIISYNAIVSKATIRIDNRSIGLTITW